MARSALDKIMETGRVWQFTAGPVDEHPDVRKAAYETHLRGHLNSEFIEVITQIQEKLKLLYGLEENAKTLTLTSSGSGALQSLINSLAQPGEDALVVTGGYFGNRMRDWLGKSGVNVEPFELDAGEVIDPETLDARLEKAEQEGQRIRIVGMVQGETSTGTLQPYDRRYSDVIHKHGALAILDTVSTLGSVPIEMDEWDLDAAFSSTQKGLSSTAGLGTVALRQRAIEKIKDTNTHSQSGYFDLDQVFLYENHDGQRQYHVTPAIRAHYALLKALEILVDEKGVEKAHEQVLATSSLLWEGTLEVSGLRDLGFAYVFDDNRMPNLHLMTVPKGIDEAKFRETLLKTHKYEISAALPPFAGQDKIRIGTMSMAITPEVMMGFLDSVGKALKDPYVSK